MKKGIISIVACACTITMASAMEKHQPTHRERDAMERIEPRVQKSLTSININAILRRIAGLIAVLNGHVVRTAHNRQLIKNTLRELIQRVQALADAAGNPLEIEQKLRDICTQAHDTEIRDFFVPRQEAVPQASVSDSDDESLDVVTPPAAVTIPPAPTPGLIARMLGSLKFW